MVAELPPQLCMAMVEHGSHCFASLSPARPQENHVCSTSCKSVLYKLYTLACANTLLGLLARKFLRMQDVTTPGPAVHWLDTAPTSVWKDRVLVTSAFFAASASPASLASLRKAVVTLRSVADSNSSSMSCIQRVPCWSRQWLPDVFIAVGNCCGIAAGHQPMPTL